MRRWRASWCRGPDCGLGRRRSARFAAAPEALDNDHATAATGAWRAMVHGGAGGHVGVVMPG